MPLINRHILMRSLALCFTLMYLPAEAAPAVGEQAKVMAPPSLEQWRGWIEQANPSRGCPAQSADACLWLGALELSESGKGWMASFAVANLSSVSVRVAMPGDDGKWPTNVKVDGAAVVVGKDALGAYVMIGPHQKGMVSFNFDLDQAESTAVAVPSGFPVVSLLFASGELRYLDPSRPVDLAKAIVKTADLSEKSPVKHGDKAVVRVSRLIQDSQVPMMVTRVRIENGGERRLVTLDGIVPEGSAVFQLQAPGARLANRSLSVEAAPGVSVLTMSSSLDPNLSIKWGTVSSSNSQLVDKQFVFIKSNESFRKISAQGEAVDPKTLDASLSFGSLPTYAVGLDGTGLALTPKAIERQGEESSGRVSKEGWLDFSGNEVFMVERVDFIKSTQGWFEPVGAWSATQASIGGAPAVVAKSEKGDGGKVATASGMGSLDIGLKTPSSLLMLLPAISSEGIVAKSASAILHIPLGWRALGVFGAGQSDAGWMASLSLWDWFLMIVAVWFAKSLLGWRKGAAVLCAMALGRLFIGAPFALYLPLLASLALLRYLPAGGFKNSAFAVVALFSASMLAQGIPYSMSRIQKVMHTALEDSAQPGSGDGAAGLWRAADQQRAEIQAAAGDAASMSVPSNAPAAPMPIASGMAMQNSAIIGGAAEESEAARAMPSIMAGSSAAFKDATFGSFKVFAPGIIPKNAQPSVVGAQAGQGVPAWQSGIAIPIRYPTPATSSAEAKVLLMPAWLVKIAAILSLAAMWITLASVFKLAIGSWRQGRRDGLAAASAAKKQDEQDAGVQIDAAQNDQGEST
jgi:hypothetical protein